MGVPAINKWILRASMGKGLFSIFYMHGNSRSSSACLLTPLPPLSYFFSHKMGRLSTRGPVPVPFSGPSVSQWHAPSFSSSFNSSFATRPFGHIWPYSLSQRASCSIQLSCCRKDHTFNSNSSQQSNEQHYCTRNSVNEHRYLRLCCYQLETNQKGSLFQIIDHYRCGYYSVVCRCIVILCIPSPTVDVWLQLSLWSERHSTVPIVWQQYHYNIVQPNHSDRPIT